MRVTERLQTPTQTGRSFAFEPSSEWKADVVYMTDVGEKNRHMLIRINSFSREIDAEPMDGNKSTHITGALTKLLERASVQPKILLTDHGQEFVGREVQALLESKNIGHATKQPRDYGAFAILDSAISKLRRLIRTQHVDKDRAWFTDLPKNRRHT